MFRTSKKLQLNILVILFIITIIVWTFIFIEERDSELLEVDFFDVNQGDSIFIEAPNGNQVLIDGGPDSTILEKLGKELPFYDRSIDLLILTHPEADHISGLLEVLKRYKIGTILYTGIFRETQEYQEWLRLIEKENIPILIVQAGEVVRLGENLNLYILYPFENLSGQKIKDTNDTSVIARLVYGNNSFLFTGDIGFSTENKLLNAGIHIDSDVLKVGHHGSKYSTSKEFLELIGPEIAIVQAGEENQYGHPSEEVLERLDNIRIFVTGKDGDIEILSDGSYLWANH